MIQEKRIGMIFYQFLTGNIKYYIYKKLRDVMLRLALFENQNFY